MIIAQLSDPHLPATPDANTDWQEAMALEKAVLAINNLIQQPDVALITGDLAKDGNVAGYDLARNILSKLQMPYFVIPGNHDIRSNLRDAFSGHEYLSNTGAFIQYVIDDYPLRLIGLDTLIPQDSNGRLCPLRLAWLRQTLDQNSDKPTLLFTHHPPFNVGEPSIDKFDIESAEALSDIVRQNSQIVTTVCGHVHRTIVREWSNIIVSCAPSTAFHLRVDLVGHKKRVLEPTPPGFALHLWKADTGIVSHFITLP